MLLKGFWKFLISVIYIIRINICPSSDYICVNKWKPIASKVCNILNNFTRFFICAACIQWLKFNFILSFSGEFDLYVESFAIPPTAGELWNLIIELGTFVARQTVIISNGFPFCILDIAFSKYGLFSSVYFIYSDQIRKNLCCILKAKDTLRVEMIRPFHFFFIVWISSIKLLNCNFNF